MDVFRMDFESGGLDHRTEAAHEANPTLAAASRGRAVPRRQGPLPPCPGPASPLAQQLTDPLERGDNLPSGQHQQREERHHSIEAAEAGIDIDGVHAAGRRRLRHIAAREIEHDERDVDTGDLTTSRDELLCGRNAGAAPDIEYACAAGETGQ